MTKSRGINRKKHICTPAELAKITREYPDRLAADIAREIGCHVQTVYKVATKLGLRKSDAFYESDLARRIQRGKQSEAMRANQFKPGQAPANKGLRRPGWAPGRMRETQFKKGQRSSNWMPLGSHRVNADGYLERKTREGANGALNWTAVHRLVWIAANGPIPADHMVAFRKGCRTVELEKITVDALECISRAENARRNRMWNIYPKELAHAIALRGALKRQIRKRTGSGTTYKDDKRSARRAVRHARAAAGQGKADGDRAGEGDR